MTPTALNAEYVALPPIDGGSAKSIAAHVAASVAIHRNMQAWMKELNKSDDLSLFEPALSDYFYSVYRWLEQSLSKLRKALQQLPSADSSESIQAVEKTQSEIRLILAVPREEIQIAKQQIAEGRGIPLQELRDALETRRRA